MYWNLDLKILNHYYVIRLTLTWDVLKSNSADNELFIIDRLTLTWDVLK